MAIKDLASNIEYRFVMSETTVVGDVEVNVPIIRDDASFNLSFVFFVGTFTGDVTISLQESDDNVTYTPIANSDLILPYDTTTITSSSLFPVSGVTVCLPIGIANEVKSWYKLVASATVAGSEIYALRVIKLETKPIQLDAFATV